MSERQGIEIDYCPKCRGVWLDRGELDKIIERSVVEEARMAAQLAPPAPPQAPSPASFFAGTPDHGGQGGHGGGHGGRRGGHGSQGSRRKRGVGSFLGELFD
jgi:Zn-finger nucleic acid-binding protein